MTVTVTGVWSLSEGDVGQTLPIPDIFKDQKNLLAAMPVVWRRNCWGLNGKPAVITAPDNVLILVGLMEQDDSNLGGIRSGLMATMTAGLASNLNSNFTRAELVAALKKVMDDTLGGPVAFGFPDHDDEIGPCHELRLTHADLHDAEHGSTVKSLRFRGKGGDYWVYLELTH